MGTKLGTGVAILFVIFASRFAEANIGSPTIDSQYILTHIQPTSIFVLPDLAGNGKNTAETPDLMIPDLKAKGYPFRTISELKGQE